jgi:hypothetical protein
VGVGVLPPPPPPPHEARSSEPIAAKAAERKRWDLLCISLYRSARIALTALPNEVWKSVGL